MVSQVMPVNGCLLLGSGKLGNFFLCLCGSRSKQNIFPFCFIFFTWKFKRENRQNKKGYDKKTVHKVNNDCTARVEQIRVDSKRVFQDIVYQRKQEKQKQCRAAFIFQPDDIRWDKPDHKNKKRNGNNDGGNVRYNGISVKKESNKGAKPFAWRAQQICRQNGDDRDWQIPVKPQEN